MELSVLPGQFQVSKHQKHQTAHRGFLPKNAQASCNRLRAAVSEYWLWSLKGPQDSQVNSRHGLSKDMVMVPQFLSLADSFVFLVP